MKENTVFSFNFIGRLSVFVLLFFAFFGASCGSSAFFYITKYNSPDFPDTTHATVENIYFRSADSSLLHGWFIKPKSGKILGTILHFHGNAGNIGYYAPFLMPLVDAGFQGMVWDYEEYGKSQGKASQEHVLEDGLAALEYVRNRSDVKGTKLILFGQSLGGHLAVVIAAREQKKLSGLIVEGAFTGHRQILAYHGWRKYLAPPLLTYAMIPSRYNAQDVVSQIKIPKLFIHSTEDKVCPYFMGEKLYAKAVSPKEFWQVKGGHCRSAQLYKEEFVAHFVKMSTEISPVSASN
jgi:fermentation-respiration switch protein FrsA (DUF1100 family)